eukprot:scaffold113422_cov17-Tisochrysis_lutea.AAC.1
MSSPHQTDSSLFLPLPLPILLQQPTTPSASKERFRLPAMPLASCAACWATPSRSKLTEPTCNHAPRSIGTAQHALREISSLSLQASTRLSSFLQHYRAPSMLSHTLMVKANTANLRSWSSREMCNVLRDRRPGDKELL